MEVDKVESEPQDKSTSDPDVPFEESMQDSVPEATPNAGQAASTVEESAGGTDGKAPDGEGSKEGEKLKLHVSGLPHFWTKAQVLKLVEGEGVTNIRKVVKTTNLAFAYLIFNDESSMQDAITKLNGVVVKTRTLHAELMEEKDVFGEASANNKRKATESANGNAGNSKKKKKGEDAAPPGIAGVVTPWYGVKTYEQQLKDKETQLINECYTKLAQMLRKKLRDNLSYQERNTGLPKWLQRKTHEDSGEASIKEYSWPVQPIKPSPRQEGYRNKCEFTIGRDEDNQLTIGFRMSSFRGGSLRVVAPTECPNVSQPMKTVCSVLQECLRKSPLELYDQMNNTGVWRQVMVRQSEKSGELMVCILVSLKTITDRAVQYDPEEARIVAELTATVNNLFHTDVNTQVPTQTSEIDTSTHTHTCTDTSMHTDEHTQEPPHTSISADTKTEIDTSTNTCTDTSMHISTHEDLQLETETSTNESIHTSIDASTETHKCTNTCIHTPIPKLVSVFVQEYDGVSMPGTNDPVRHVWGKEGITDTIMDVHFRVSPSAFFQVNTTGAEVLYRTVVEEAKLTASSLLVDVCCGTGAIGLCAAKASGCKVVGIEICEAAVHDARANAEANNIPNTHFVCGKAEDTIHKVLAERVKHHPDGARNVSVVVDPPREGLHMNVIRGLRGCSLVKRLVYVSCNPVKGLVNDAYALCGPESKKTKGAPFEVVGAAPVDMFPHTPHCELVMVFERQ